MLLRCFFLYKYLVECKLDAYLVMENIWLNVRLGAVFAYEKYLVEC